MGCTFRRIVCGRTYIQPGGTGPRICAYNGGKWNWRRYHVDVVQPVQEVGERAGGGCDAVQIPGVTPGPNR